MPRGVQLNENDNQQTSSNSGFMTNIRSGFFLNSFFKFKEKGDLCVCVRERGREF